VVSYTPFVPALPLLLSHRLPIISPVAAGTGAPRGEREEITSHRGEANRRADGDNGPTGGGGSLQKGHPRHDRLARACQSAPLTIARSPTRSPTCFLRDDESDPELLPPRASDSTDQYVELRAGINATMSQTSTTLKNIDATRIGANGNLLLLPQFATANASAILIAITTTTIRISPDGGPIPTPESLTDDRRGRSEVRRFAAVAARR
jgi:hypothetical protein